METRQDTFTISYKKLQKPWGVVDSCIRHCFHANEFCTKLIIPLLAGRRKKENRTEEVNYLFGGLISHRDCKRSGSSYSI